LSKSTFPSDIAATIVKTANEGKKNSEAQTIERALLVRHRPEIRWAHAAAWHNCRKKLPVSAILAWVAHPVVMVPVSLPQTQARLGLIGRAERLENAGTSFAHPRLMQAGRDNADIDHS
jgi:hypothetical protein